MAAGLGPKRHFAVTQQSVAFGGKATLPAAPLGVVTAAGSRLLLTRHLPSGRADRL